MSLLVLLLPLAAAALLMAVPRRLPAGALPLLLAAVLALDVLVMAVLPWRPGRVVPAAVLAAHLPADLRAPGLPPRALRPAVPPAPARRTRLCDPA